MSATENIVPANFIRHIIAADKESNKHQGRVATRFPPEPNGYLHIGHAKAMRFNFKVAEDHKGFCYLRYDDTDQEKESKEYIDSIRENVEWLGYKPWKITYASDYFPEMYELAKKLIMKGKAFVCNQTKEEMNLFRKEMRNSPFRERSIEENLELFEKMKRGEFKEKEVYFFKKSIV